MRQLPAAALRPLLRRAACSSLVPALTAMALAPAAWAAEGVDPLTVGGGNASENAPGPRFGINRTREVSIRGMLALDVINRGQYLTGNRDQSDHQGTGNIRAEFGTGVKLDERVRVSITLAYEAEAGDNTADDPTGTNRNGFTVVDDAYVQMKEFLGFESLGVTLGRQPVSWNLRPNKGALLYDSAANHPRVTSWDGAKGDWNIWEEIDVHPFAYSVPGASTLFGAAADWKPSRSGDDRTFLTGAFTWERKAPNRVVDPTLSRDSTIVLTDAQPGDRLLTYYGGLETQLGDVDLYIEGAVQRGDLDGGISYAGFGGNAGIDWHVYPAQALVLGVKVDHLSGNSEPASTSGTNRAFVNNWEGVSDTYIVEHEQYGELSRLLTGSNAFGLQSIKGNAGISFDDRNRVRLDGIYAFYRTAETTTTGGRIFGHEGDLTLTWKYTTNTAIKLFGGGFLPHGAYQAVAPGPKPGRDLIYLMGSNLSVVF
jgi:hypothetical protein